MARTGASYEDALREAQELGYAEADPTEDVSGKDAAAKMAILARLAFGAAVHLDDVPYEGIEHLTADDIAYAKELGLSLKLVGTAERIGERHRRARLPGVPLRRPPAGVGQRLVQRGHDRVAGHHRDHAVGPGRRRLADRLGRAGRRGLGHDPAALDCRRRRWTCRWWRTSSRPSTCTSRWPTGRACWPRWRRSSGCRACRCGRWSSSGLGDDARLVMVMHPVLESKFRAARGPDRPARLRALGAARDPRASRSPSRRAAEPLALPRPAAGRAARHARARATRRWCPRRTCPSCTGCEVWLKLEGANPTGSFKDRGMTVAVSAAIQEGAEAVICASTGNTAASAAAYAARAGLRGAVIVPEGKIATGKLAQALMHGARVVALRGNFDQALALVRELAEKHPIVARQLGERLPDRGPEDRRLRGRATSSARRPTCSASRWATPATSPRGGGASTSTSAAPRLHGYQAEGAAPLVHGAPVENPETVASAIRIGNPARWEEAMDAVHRLARRDPRGVRRRDPRRLHAARRARGRLLRAGLGGLGGGPAQVRRRGPRGLRAHRPRAQGPAHGDDSAVVGGPLRARRSTRSRRRCSE